MRRNRAGSVSPKWESESRVNLKGIIVILVFACMYRFFNMVTSSYSSLDTIVPFRNKRYHSISSVLLSFTLSLLLVLNPLVSYAQGETSGPSGQIEDGPSGTVSPDEDDGVGDLPEPPAQGSVDSGGPIHPSFELPDDYVDNQDTEDGASGASGSSSGTTGTIKSSGNVIHPLIDNLDGSLTYSYSLTVPEGRNGFTPQHNLVFKSSNKKNNGIFGYGWEVDIPYIERSTKKGSNKIYTNDDYISSLDGEIVKQNTASISSTSYPVKEYAIGSEQKIVPTDWQASSRFGQRVSLNGDYLAMSAPAYDLDDNERNGTDGVVYIYKRQSSGSWTFLQRLSDATYSSFGENISLSGDYLAVTVSSNKVFVYKRGTNDVWGNRTEIQVSDAGTVYLDDDILAVKARDRQSWWYIEVYKRNDAGSWIKKESLYPSARYGNRNTSGEFGDRISLAGNRLVVTTGNGPAVFIYEEDVNGGWGNASKPGNTTKYENQVIIGKTPFGTSVAINGNTLAIGMSGESTGIESSGAVYVYTRESDGTWGNPVKLKASDSHSNIVFGSWGVLLDGDTLTVGARDTKHRKYMFYVYKEKSDGTWGFERKVIPPDITGDFSARSISLDGGYIAAGFTRFDSRRNRYDGGEVYTYKISETTTKSTTQSEMFKPRTEKGAFRKYEKIGDYWVVTDTVGTKYYFGETLQARQDGTVQWETETFKWMLEKIEDTNGNTIEYTYTKDHGQIYPKKIEYVNTSGGSYVYSLQFTKQERNDKTKLFNTGFPVKTKYIINGIDFYKGTEKLFSYKQDLELVNELKYTYVIKALYKYGKDADGNWTTEPKTTFGYTDTISYTENSSYGSTGPSGLADATRDGMPDVVSLGATNDTQVNNGNGFNSAIDMFPTFDSVQGKFDMNGDYYPDFLQVITRRCKRCSTNSYIYKNNGSLNTFSRTSINRDFHSSWADGLGDINGDGTLDVFPKKYDRHTRGGGWRDYTTTLVFLNADGFNPVQSSTISVPYILYYNRGDPYHGPYYGLRAPNFLIDYNGDGLADISRSKINNGFGWSADIDYLNYPTIYFADGNNNFSTDRYAGSWKDINTDGMYDLIVTDIYNDRDIDRNIKDITKTHNYGYRVYLSKGIDGYQYSKKYTDALRNAGILEHAGSNSNGNIYVNAIIDVNGDGINDVYYKKYRAGSRNLYDYKYFIADNTFELDTITTEYGGSFDISYTGAGVHDTTNKVPFPLRIVSSIAYTDTYATDNTETLGYTGGYYYFNGPSDKKFAGFETVERTQGNRKEKIYYHQGNGQNSTNAEPTDSYAKIGLPYKKEIYQAAVNEGESNILLEKIEYTYGETSNGTNSTYVYLTKEKKTVYGSGNVTFGDDYSNSTEYTYDTYGNVLTETKKSGTAVLRKVVYTYKTPDTTNYIVSLLSEETIKNASDVIIVENEYTYDSNGNMLTKKRKIDGTTKQKRTYTYNTRGRVLTENDSLNNTTTYTYDTNSLRLTQETNPLSHVTQYEYDETSGEGNKNNRPERF